MYRETHSRSLVKTISYRFWSSVLTAILVLLLTGQWLAALTIGGLEVLLKMALYFYHERLWDRIKFGRRQVTPAVLWFTGLSGAGKSTLGEALCQELKTLKLPVENLDGDVIRTIFPHTGFTHEEREEHIQRVGYLASRLEQNGVFVVAALISPYRDSRNFIRQICQNFIEIHVSTPLTICEQRDPKGLYAEARAGKIEHFTGIDDPYEIPKSAELILDTSVHSVEECTQKILNYLKKNRYL